MVCLHLLAKAKKTAPCYADNFLNYLVKVRAFPVDDAAVVLVG